MDFVISRAAVGVVGLLTTAEHIVARFTE
jgi:hypothetical protein